MEQTTIRRQEDIPAAMGLCCQLAALCPAPEGVREILEARRDRANQLIPDPTIQPYPNTLQEQVSRAMLSLGWKGTRAAETDAYVPPEEIIPTLPDSPEKDYLLALLALSRGGDTARLLEASRRAAAALAQAPNDPRFIALAELLEEAAKEEGTR